MARSNLTIRQRISTLLFISLTTIGAVVLLGLAMVSLRLFEIQGDLGQLRDNSLPLVAKLAQLSQEASATSSIAPALSTKPTHSEFDTLLSRIRDKEGSQRSLTKELAELDTDPESVDALKRNSELLIANLQSLTTVVSEQIAVNQRLDEQSDQLRDLIGHLTASDAQDTPNQKAAGNADSGNEFKSTHIATTAAFQLINMLLDPNRAHLPRNTRETDATMKRLAATFQADAASDLDELPKPLGAARQVSWIWSNTKDRMLADKSVELSNAFRIKALAEENALIANRLLSSASNEFWHARTELENQIRLVNDTAQFTLLSIVVVLVAFTAGNVVVWLVLKRRVFARLDRLRDSLRDFAENRQRASTDPRRDEIGEISNSLTHYMGVIDQREAELAEKTGVLEQLSTQLSKYLSPQVYDSIFTGKQEVKVASSRKKLTIFFSDIADFTETADRLESEELTLLLNEYLTEMSIIALHHGATIDKYVGDAILIFFGDPESRGVQQDALACVEMAIAMRKRMRELQDRWRESGIEKPLRARMGVHTGYCTVGNFGSEDRMDYTIIGGAVNTASRLESVAPPEEILVSYETFAHINTEICCTEFGEIDVKGIAYPIATYKVVDTYQNLQRERRAFRQEHPHLRVDIEFDGMTATDRCIAEKTLRHALQLVTSHGEGASDDVRHGNLPNVESEGSRHPGPTDSLSKSET